MPPAEQTLEGIVNITIIDPQPDAESIHINNLNRKLKRIEIPVKRALDALEPHLGRNGAVKVSSDDLRVIFHALNEITSELA